MLDTGNLLVKTKLVDLLSIPAARWINLEEFVKRLNIQ